VCLDGGTQVYQLIDADSHINEPPDLWTSRVPAKFRDRRGASLLNFRSTRARIPHVLATRVERPLRALEAANLVTTVRAGRTKLHYLNPVPIHEIQQRWIEQFEPESLLETGHVMPQAPWEMHEELRAEQMAKR
jgi:hypothetical protein